jgi:nitrous oxidase accessory protein NosD
MRRGLRIGAIAVAATAGLGGAAFLLGGGDDDGGPPVPCREPGASRPDAGLAEPFRRPRPPGASPIDVRAFGAIPDDDIDDAAALSAAVVEAGTGGTVVLGSGRYRIERPIDLASGVRIAGESPERTVVETAFADRLGERDAYAFGMGKGVTDAAVADLAITQVGGALGYGVLVSGAERVEVADVRVERFSKGGVWIRDGASHVSVRDAEIARATDLGGEGHGYGITLSGDVHHAWVSGNTLGPRLRHGVIIQFRAHNNLVERNTSRGIHGDAFDFHGEEEFRNELRLNRALGGGGSGIEVGKTGGVHAAAGPCNWIHHNEVTGHQFGITVGFQSHEQVVEDNRFHANEEAGILATSVDRKNALVRGLVVARNRSEDNGVGGSFRHVERLRIEDNTFTGNRLGLSIESTVRDYWIVGNDLRGNRRSLELGSPSGVVRDNRGLD